MTIYHLRMQLAALFVKGRLCSIDDNRRRGLFLLSPHSEQPPLRKWWDVQGQSLAGKAPCYAFRRLADA